MKDLGYFSSKTQSQTHAHSYTEGESYVNVNLNLKKKIIQAKLFLEYIWSAFLLYLYLSLCNAPFTLHWYILLLEVLLGWFPHFVLVVHNKGRWPLIGLSITVG